jgi:hypothetical protein
MRRSFRFGRLFGPALSVVLAVVPLLAGAQDEADTDWNHLGLNFRAGFNIRARFSTPSSLVFPPGPGAGSAVNRQYNDGFVNVDSSGNQGGQTWNWGYRQASQVSGNNVLMHASGLERASEHATDDPNLGLDFNYVRDIAHPSWGQWGIKVGAAYTRVDVRDAAPMSANVETITDKYPLNGVTPPMAPYSGSFSGPGPVIGSKPSSRTTAIAPNGAIITGDHSLEASLFDLRLGPSFNIPLFNRFSLQTGGGLAVGLVYSHFSFTESSTAGAGPVSASGSSTRTGLVPGAYAEAGFAYRIWRSTSLFTGAQFEYLGDFQQGADGRTARLDFGRTVFYEFGLQWHF